MTLRFLPLLMILAACRCSPEPHDSGTADSPPPEDSAETGESTTDSAPPDDSDLPSADPACLDLPGFERFVTRDGARLMVGDEPLRFASLNVPNLMMVEDDSWRLPDPWEQRDALCAIAQLGGQVTRGYVVSVGDSWSKTPRHVTAPGVFSEPAFVAMDHMLDQASRNGVRVIVPLVDQWSWWGGIAEYAAFRNKAADTFWTDPQLLADFLLTVDQVLGRTNTVNGRAYIDDPTILAWETGNELSSPTAWTAAVAAHIRGVDPNHLIMDGHYGVDPASLDNPDVDIVSNHYYWPEPFGHDYPAALAADLATVGGRRPFVLGELGVIDTWVIEGTLAAFEASDAAGIMLWSLRSHDVDGGFHWHTEYDDGATVYRAYHWPGFPTGDDYDEVEVLELLRAHAWSVRGLEPEPIPVPEAPVILSIHDDGDIHWRGSTGAAWYVLERSRPFECCPEIVTDGFHDALTPNQATVRDPWAQPGETWSYLLRACNVRGCSEASEISEPFTHSDG